ncbi:hypothetical protein [Microbulbifer aestuariivivens]|uniref:hypothetical protein n=1 Tax=Microbulbifer aestuariivivens TaxID=1908308 RepID=UPI0031ECB9DC
MMRYFLVLLFFISSHSLSESKFSDLKILEEIEGVSISIFNIQEIGWRNYRRQSVEYCIDHKCYVFSALNSKDELCEELTELVAYMAILSQFSELKIKGLLDKGFLRQLLISLNFDSAKSNKSIISQKISKLLEPGLIEFQLKTYDGGEYTRDLDSFEVSQILSDLI